MEIFVIVIFILYLILTLALWLYWEAIPILDKQANFEPSVTVLIALRNEAHNVENLFRSLAALDYPVAKLQVVLVDDNSTDDTLNLIRKQASLAEFSIDVLELVGDKGKKAALNIGLKKAVGQIVITTDADCSFDAKWLSTIVTPFFNKQISLVSGPVKIASNGNFFSRIQSMEFSSLIASGAATIRMGFPTMANAANMAIRKSILDRPFVIRGESRSSGDDIFTLHAIAAENPGSIVFCRDPHSIVTTHPLYSFSGFFNQRIRWAGKWNSYNSLPTILLALFVFLVNILTISLPFLVIFEKISWLLLANLIIARILFEYLFLREIQKFFGNKILLHEFIILAIIYPFYVTITAIWGSLSGYNWKGRRTR